MVKYYASTSSEVSQLEKKHMEEIRSIAGECMVLLENDGTLPLTGKAGKIALYGNGARGTVKGGTGSGDVYSRVVINIEQGLEEAGFTITTKSWLDSCDKLMEEMKTAFITQLEAEAKEKGVTPMDIILERPVAGPELRISSVTQEDVNTSNTDTAIYVLARKSGEGADRFYAEGDYLLTKEEVATLQFIRRAYAKCILLLNVGGIIDLKAISEIGFNSVMLISQAGNITGYAAADVLCAKTFPSGKLADTWAEDYYDYPNSKSFSHNNGNVDDEYYSEGIYVGYRYFDSFNVTPRYCFGYGRSYTDFLVQTQNVIADEEKVTVTVKVSNTGKIYSGKEVVQIYYSAPSGKVEKPYQELVAFGKTMLLAPGESQVLSISFKTSSMASYRKEKASWIMEAGEYLIRVGENSRNTRIEAVIILEQEAVTEVLTNLFQEEPNLTEISAEGTISYSYAEEKSEKTAARRIPIEAAKILTNKVKYQADKINYSSTVPEKITMEDVIASKYSLEEMTAQLTIDEMAQLCVGTSRGSLFSEDIIGNASVVAPGAAGDTTSLMATDRLIRNLILADGPAGVRLKPHFKTTKEGVLLPGGNIFMEEASGFASQEKTSEDVIDYYQYTTAIPIASLLASSWDMEAIEKAGYIVGEEMLQFGINLWLAPGMNIHRNPLCGRNFEYYSEDPILTGMCAAATTLGVQAHPGIGTTIKHYAVNNQEDNRLFSNSLVSERTLREIYLKGFEIAVMTAQPMAVMTSYNLMNGIHTANSYDLLTAALREEWGFAGLVMTDWCTSQDLPFMHSEIRKYPVSSSPLCIKAGNDLQMPGCQQNIEDIIEAVNAGEAAAPDALTLGDLQFCARNILNIIKQSSCYEGAKPYNEQFGELPWIMKVR